VAWKDATRPASLVEILPGKHAWELRYTGLSLTAPEKVRFATGFERLERDWSTPPRGAGPSTATCAPAATLHVTASNSDAV